MNTIEHEGHEYIVVHDWRPDEKLAYRDLPHGQVEMLELFCGDVKLTMLNANFAQWVLDHRIMQKRVSS